MGTTRVAIFQPETGVDSSHCDSKWQVWGWVIEPGWRGQIISLCLVPLMIWVEGIERGQTHEETLRGSKPVLVCLPVCLLLCLSQPVRPFYHCFSLILFGYAPVCLPDCLFSRKLWLALKPLDSKTKTETTQDNLIWIKCPCNNILRDLTTDHSRWAMCRCLLYTNKATLLSMCVCRTENHLD